MNDIKSWILNYLQENGMCDVSCDQPLFEQIDSFEVIGFLLACEEKYHCFYSLDGSGLSRLNIDEIADLISKKIDA